VTAAAAWTAAFAADLHLAPADREGIARAVTLIELCRERAARLFLLGDLFDLWTSGAELALPELSPLFDSLRRAKASGLAIAFLAGNRDFNFTAADGARVGIDVQGEEELAVELDGRGFRLLHGDQLLRDDVAYQRMKAVIRSGPARFLARHLPEGFSLALGRRLRRYSDRVVPRKESGRLRIVPEAVRARFTRERERMLCGHVHRLDRIDFGAGRELLVLPPFYEEGRFLVLSRGELAIATLDGALHELPAARAAEAG
jgi:UDP-2,3-diacylglucosamine hydrolase